MQNLTHEGLEIRVDLGTPGRIGFVWNGRATSKEPGKVLTPFFDRALTLALETGSWIEMHFEDLQHFNSSTIAAVIQFINSAHSRHVDVVSMVVGELVENALKHGAWNGDADPKGAEARLRISGAPSGVQIEVTNPLPLGANPQVLFSMLDRIRAAATPQDAYVERLREVARDVTVRGGLGLMRIAYEASASLTAAVAEDRITVRASLD